MANVSNILSSLYFFFDKCLEPETNSRNIDVKFSYGVNFSKSRHEFPYKELQMQTVSSTDSCHVLSVSSLGECGKKLSICVTWSFLPLREDLAN